MGYGGTKAELERLMKDAEKLTGEKYDISNFADIIKAIKAVQDELGITGTTAKEASETITGSALAMKAAWANFITGLADDNADFEQLLDNLLDSVRTFLKNIIPRIKKMLPRLVRGLTEIAKAIGQEMPDILQDLLPSLVEGAVDLLGSMWDVLKSNVGVFKSVGLSIIKAIYEGITGKEMPTETFDKLKKKLDDIMTAIGKIIGGFIDFGRDLLVALGPALLWVADMAVAAFCWIGENIDWLLPILGSLLGAMLAFKAVKSVTGIVQGFMGLFSLFGGKKGGAAVAGGALGGGGSSGGGFFSPKSVAKALGSIAIAIGGVAAIIAVFAALKQIPGYEEFMADGGTSLKQLTNIIADIGLVGAAFVGFAGLVGMMPIATVASGMANIAIALGGMEAVVVAFGALSKIPGLDKFMTDGGELLVQLCGIIGEMAGSIIGGIGEGITNSLADIGANICAFATSIEPAMSTFSGMNSEGLKDFATAFGAFVAVMAGESLLSWFAGGIDYAKIGTDLSALVTNGADFFAKVADIPKAAFTNATALFDCLAGLKSLPKDGGVVGWFTGEVDYSKMATGLKELSNEGVIGFFTAIATIPATAFTNATNFFDCLAGMDALPSEGGIFSWFTGDVNYSGIASGLKELGGVDVIGFFTAVATIPATAFTNATSLFDCLQGVSTFATGDFTFLSDIMEYADDLPGFGTNVALFYAAIVSVDPAKITAFFTAMSGIASLGDDGGWFSSGSKFDGLASLGESLSGLGTQGAAFFEQINGLNADNLTVLQTFLTNSAVMATAVTNLGTAMETALGKVVTNIGTKMTEAKTAIDTGLRSAISAVQNKRSGFYSAGMYIMQGLNAGINSMRSTLIATANSIANSIRSTLNNALDVHSPSRVTFETGEYAGMGLNLGMQSMIPDIKSTATELGSASIPYGGTYTPEGSATYYNSNGGNSEITTISPVFNLTVSGTQDDRATARRIKRYVAEAIAETFESMERTGHLSLV